MRAELTGTGGERRLGSNCDKMRGSKVCPGKMTAAIEILVAWGSRTASNRPHENTTERGLGLELPTVAPQMSVFALAAA